MIAGLRDGIILVVAQSRIKGLETRAEPKQEPKP